MITSTQGSALYAIKAANKWSDAAATASERISSTLRINHSSDDPSGLMLATNLSAELSSYTRAIDNIHSGIAAVQMVDASLTSIASYLTEMRTLAVSAASASSATALAAYQTSFSSYRDDIDNVATYTTLNGSSLMDGSTTSLAIQVGIASGDSRSLSFSSATASSLGLSSLDVSSDASTAITTIDTALVTIGSYQSKIGAYETLLDTRETLANNMVLAKTTAYGNIMDADIAAETTALASAQIGQEAATAVMVQANTISKEIVTYLLKGITS
jgi:flagellin